MNPPPAPTHPQHRSEILFSSFPHIFSLLLLCLSLSLSTHCVLAIVCYRAHPTTYDLDVTSRFLYTSHIQATAVVVVVQCAAAVLCVCVESINITRWCDCVHCFVCVCYRRRPITFYFTSRLSSCVYSPPPLERDDLTEDIQPINKLQVMGLVSVQFRVYNPLIGMADVQTK